MLARENSEDFKRSFGEGRDLKDFCKDNKIEMPDQPFIKTKTNFCTSLAQERLFIESSVTKKVKFDIFGSKGGPKLDENQLRGEKTTLHPIHENISSVKDHLLTVIE